MYQGTTMAKAQGWAMWKNNNNIIQQEYITPLVAYQGNVKCQFLYRQSDRHWTFVNCYGHSKTPL